MARLWSTGFEANSTTAWHEFTSIVGSPTIQTSVVRSGTYALRANPTAAAHYITHAYKNFSDSAAGYFRAYIRIATAPSAATMIMGQATNGTGIRLNTDRTLTLMKADSTALGSNSAALALNTWYRVEYQFQTSATIDGRLDGVSFASGTNSSAGSLDSFFCGIITATTADVYFDDLAINDTTGSNQNSFPGSGKIVHLYPNASGNSNTLLKSGGGAGSTTNYQDMDEITPDDGTSYLKTTVTGDNDKNDTYNVESSSAKGIGSGDTVNLVVARVRHYLGYSNNWTGVVARIRYNSTNTDSGITEASTASTWYTFRQATSGTPVRGTELHTTYVAPGGGSWTPTILDTTEVGVVSKVNTFNSENRFSQAYLLVDYTPSTIITTTKTQTGVSRITQVVPQTQTGVSRITATVTRDQTGVANLTSATVTTTKTQTGVARIFATILQTQAGISRITATTPKTQTGITRITQVVTANQIGVARITAIVTRDQTGVSNIFNTVTRTQTGVAKVVYTNSQTIVGRSTISKTGSTTTTNYTTASADDASETLADVVSISAETARFDRDSHLGYKFPDITIAQGATIQSAYFKVRLNNYTGAGTILGSIFGNNVDNAASFSTATADITGRARTTASVANPDAGLAWDTGNGIAITSIIQEIINRAGWVSNNDIALLMIGDETGANTNYVEAFLYDYTVGSLGFYKAELRITVQGGDIPYTRYQYGVANIAPAAAIGTQTQTGISRITATTTRDQAGKSSILNAVLKTQVGVARITQTVLTTQTGISRITAVAPKTQVGVARITATATRTQTGVSRVSVVVAKDQTGISRIQFTRTNIQTGVARITASVDRTTTGISRITATTTRNQTGVSRLTVTVTRNQTGVTNIAGASTRNQTGIASILNAVVRDQLGKAAIVQTVLRTQLGVSRIQVVVTKVQTGITRIQVSVDRSQTGKSAILKTVSVDQAGVARIFTINSKLQTGVSRISLTTIRTQTGISRITASINRDQTGVANIMIRGQLDGSFFFFF